MTINQQTLRELCVRVASGDEQARKDFDRHVPRLVEIVVHRWLRQQSDDAMAPAGTTPRASRARQITEELCARMIADCKPHCLSATRASDETLVVCGTADTLAWA